MGWIRDNWVSAVMVVIFCGPAMGATLPPDALALLNSLPEKKVSLGLVLVRAMQASDSFKEIEAQKFALNVAELQSKAALDYQFTFSAGVSDDQSEPTTPFGTTRAEGYEFSLGALKKFSTGTSISLNLTDTKQDLTSPSFTALSYEPKVTLSVTQDLWKDGFGYGTRRAAHAGVLLTQANQAAYQDAVQDWVLQLTGIFYEAWGAQAGLRTANKTVARREKLLRTTRQKVRRGTAEKPDLLQVKSALLEDKVRQQKAIDDLVNKWRSLAIALKFQEAWLDLDPTLIPMGLDQPVDSELSVCADLAEKKNVPNDNYALRSAELSAQAAQLKLEQAKNSTSPSLQLKGSLSNNAVDPINHGQAVSEFFDLAHPGWSVGLEFSIPLSNFAAQAQARTAIADSMRQKAQAAIARDKLKLDWLTACSDLTREQQTYEMRTQAFKNETERARLDQKRFSLGRITTNIAVMSEDAAAQAEVALHQAQIQRRLAAWKVRKLRGNIQQQLETNKRKLQSILHFQ